MTSSKDRHLMAVMFTDVVGYTALMQDDENAARAVRARHRYVLEQRIADYGGELLQYLGDGSLSIFPSAVNAVAAAVEIQREARADPALPLRIGIHQGEINFDAQGAYGDSVNIAARIEHLGVAGSVLISGKVHDDVKNQPAYATVSLGQFELKNVKRPVEVYALVMDGLAVPTRTDVEAARERVETKDVMPLADGTAVVPVADGVAIRPRRSRIPWLTAALGVLALLFAAAWILTLVDSEPPSVARFDVTPSQGRAMLPNVAGVDVAISPDGQRIVYVGQAAGGTQLWQRRVGDLDPHPIRGTSDGRDPVFSPDGQSVAFRVGASLRTIPIAGGDPTIVVGQDVTGGADWGPDGLLYYPTGSTLYRVSPRGGDPEPVTPQTAGVHRYPQVLPGGRAVLFTIERPGGPDNSMIAVASPGADTVQEIVAGMMARYARSEHLLFGTANGTVRAAPFNLRRLAIDGPTVTILTARDLRDGPPTKFAVSSDGTLIYRTGLVEPIVMQFAWVTRSGRATLVDAEWTFNPGRDNRSWDISPDGSRIALKALTDLGSDIWVKTLPDGPIARFTFDPAEERMPRWSPDGQNLLFISPRNGNLDVWSRRTDGSGDAVLVADLEQSIADVVWSPDGQWLIMRTAGAAGVVGNRDLYVMRVGVDTIPRKLLAAGTDEASPAFSPDGRWLAYHSEETGRREVFVRPFPNVEAGQFQVSAGGGRAPVWSNRGDELFYVADGNGENATSRRLMVATIDPDPTFQVMRRQVLFPIEDNYYLANNTTAYRVASDDERFLMARYVGESARVELVLVQNFFEELRENVGR